MQLAGGAQIYPRDDPRVPLDKRRREEAEEMGTRDGRDEDRREVPLFLGTTDLSNETV
jgi:hypothetical protein